MADHDPRCKYHRSTRPCAHDGGDIEYPGGVFVCDKCFEVRSAGSNPWLPMPSRRIQWSCCVDWLSASSICPNLADGLQSETRRAQSLSAGIERRRGFGSFTELATEILVGFVLRRDLRKLDFPSRRV